MLEPTPRPAKPRRFRIEAGRQKRQHASADLVLRDVGRVLGEETNLLCAIAALALVGASQVSAIFTTAAFGQGHVNINTANYVMPGCRSFLARSKNEDPFLQGRCFGLVDGIALGLAKCLPTDITLFQVMRVVVQYIDSQPARLHEDFRLLAGEAMVKAWPCPVSSKEM